MISRITLLICFLIGITCVTSQNVTIQSQLSTNQTLALYYQCNDPWATAIDNQGVIFGSCAQNNGSEGILWTYRDAQGNQQTGWVTSPGNGSCTQSHGIAVSQNGEYLFATCSGNLPGMQIMAYVKQTNGNIWTWTPVVGSLNTTTNTTTLACGGDIVFDDMTEDLYAICGTTLTSNDQRIVKFQHNTNTDNYDIAIQDLNIPANYIKYNPLNNYLYYATTTNLGYLVIHNPDNTSMAIPSNPTVIPVNGTLSNWCEITSFTWLHNSTNTLFIGCTGFQDVTVPYTSYSILRVDMNQTIVTVNQTIVTNNSTNLNNTNTTTTLTTQSILTFMVMNISYTNSQLSGIDGSNNLTYPADGSCKAPSAMAVDSMNQLYVACKLNAPTRSVIRYTQINSTYYLPAYVTTATECNQPLNNSLSIDMHDNVLVSCSASNRGLFFTTPTSNITVTPPTNSSTGANGNSSSSSSTGTTGTGITTIITGTGSSGTTSTSSTGISSTTTGIITSTTTGTITSTTTGTITSTTTGTRSSTGIISSSTASNNGTINNMSSQVHVDMGGFILAIILLIVSM